jgi:putative FmdB family regulatory protein
MNRSNDLYLIESDKSVGQFVSDFTDTIKKYGFVINNLNTMNMKKTFREHGGEVPNDFDLHMIQVCKPTKADKSLTMNPERAIFMPKFVMVFSRNGKTQIRYLSYSVADIEALVLDDPKFAESVSQTFIKIRSMIDEAQKKSNLPISIFEYKCNKCENEFKKRVSADNETEVSCPECNTKQVTKKISAA